MSISRPVSNLANAAKRPSPLPESEKLPAPSLPRLVVAAPSQVNNHIASSSTSPPVVGASLEPVPPTSTKPSKTTHAMSNKVCLLESFWLFQLPFLRPGSRIVSMSKKNIHVPPNSNCELQSRKAAKIAFDFIPYPRLPFLKLHCYRFGSTLISPTYAPLSRSFY